MAEPILEAKGLWKTYGRRPRKRHLAKTLGQVGGPRPALIDAALTVAAGETIGVVGESGSGKSTLARCLALLILPDAGEVIFHGQELTSMRPREFRPLRRRIQTIFQDPYSSLNPRMTVGAMLAEVLRVHRLVPRGGMRGRVTELLGLVGLPPGAARRYPSEFSGGQRQRVSIARALAAEPDVLIADEPVSALDVSIQAQILNLLADLQVQLGLAMIFIGHDLPVVTYVAPRLAVMFSGRIVELMPKDVPLSRARHPYTQELLAAVPSLTSTSLPAVALSRSHTEAPFSLDRCVYWERCTYRLDPHCETETPPLREVGPGHYVACFYGIREVSSTLGGPDG